MGVVLVPQTLVFPSLYFLNGEYAYKPTILAWTAVYMMALQVPVASSGVLAQRTVVCMQDRCQKVAIAVPAGTDRQHTETSHPPRSV